MNLLAGKIFILDVDKINLCYTQLPLHTVRLAGGISEQ